MLFERKGGKPKDKTIQLTGHPQNFPMASSQRGGAVGGKIRPISGLGKQRTTSGRKGGGKRREICQLFKSPDKNLKPVSANRARG